VGGIILALLIFWTAAHLKQVSGNAPGTLELSFGKLKVSTTNLLVGLAIIVLIAMVGIPAYFLKLYFGIDDRRMGLTVTFSEPLHGSVMVRSDDGASVKTDSPQLQVYKTRDHQAFSIENPNGKVYAIPIVVWYEWNDQHPWVIINNGIKQKISDFDGVSGSIGPVRFMEAQVASAPPPKRPTIIRGANSAVFNVADPLAIQQATDAAQTTVPQK
jgi:hypothetical protein